MRIIGLGQPAAGDDGVGFAVIEALRSAALPSDVELLKARNAGELVDLLDGCERAVIVDAATGAPPGSVHALRPGELSALRGSPVSSHGLGVGEALQLSRALGRTAAHVDVVAIGIDPPRRYESKLSPPVQAAVTRAREVVIEVALARSDDGSALEEHA